jgi:hypothetical protein
MHLILVAWLVANGVQLDSYETAGTFNSASACTAAYMARINETGSRLYECRYVNGDGGLLPMDYDPSAPTVNKDWPEGASMESSFDPKEATASARIISAKASLAKATATASHATFNSRTNVTTNNNYVTTNVSNHVSGKASRSRAKRKPKT